MKEYLNIDEPIFDIRHEFGRQVLVLGNLVTVDYDIDDNKEPISK